MMEAFGSIKRKMNCLDSESKYVRRFYVLAVPLGLLTDCAVAGALGADDCPNRLVEENHPDDSRHDAAGRNQRDNASRKPPWQIAYKPPSQKIRAIAIFLRGRI